MVSQTVGMCLSGAGEFDRSEYRRYFCLGFTLAGIHREFCPRMPGRRRPLWRGWWRRWRRPLWRGRALWRPPFLWWRRFRFRRPVGASDALWSAADTVIAKTRFGLSPYGFSANLGVPVKSYPHRRASGRISWSQLDVGAKTPALTE
jgi:hypothetical protein